MCKCYVGGKTIAERHYEPGISATRRWRHFDEGMLVRKDEKKLTDEYRRVMGWGHDAE